MANLTYLLGAGASSNCLPTYRNFSKRFESFKQYIQNNINHLFPEDRSAAGNLISLCDRLTHEFTFHNTPDTVAKKYFHSKNSMGDNLNNLKILLTLYFIFEQSLGTLAIVNAKIDLNEKTPLERRYDSFLASILEPVYSEIRIYPNFNILTWNYDLQFEICFNNYYGNGFVEAQKQIQSIPSPETIKPTFSFNSSEFAIVHLNGVAYSEKSDRFPDSKIPFGNIVNDDSLLIKIIIDHFQTLISNENKGNKYLNFAWERSSSFPHPKEIMELTFKCASVIAEKTELLIIIGYSFPIFNRDVDLEIFRKMKKLSKVFIQSPVAKNLKDNFIEIFRPVNSKVNPNTVDIIDNVDYFHIPQGAGDYIKDKYPIF